MNPSSTLQVVALMAEWRSREGGSGRAERLAQREEALKLHCQRAAPGCKAMIAYAEQIDWYLNKGGLNRGAILVCEDAFASLLPRPDCVDTVRALMSKGVRVIDASTNTELGTYLTVLDRLARTWDRSRELDRMREQMHSQNDALTRDIASIGSRVASDMVQRGLFTMMRQAVDTAFRDGASAPVSTNTASRSRLGEGTTR